MFRLTFSIVAAEGDSASNVRVDLTPTPGTVPRAQTPKKPPNPDLELQAAKLAAEVEVLRSQVPVTLAMFMLQSPDRSLPVLSTLYVQQIDQATCVISFHPEHDFMPAPRPFRLTDEQCCKFNDHILGVLDCLLLEQRILLDQPIPLAVQTRLAPQCATQPLLPDTTPVLFTPVYRRTSPADFELDLTTEPSPLTDVPCQPFLNYLTELAVRALVPPQLPSNRPQTDPGMSLTTGIGLAMHLMTFPDQGANYPLQQPDPRLTVLAPGECPYPDHGGFRALNELRLTCETDVGSMVAFERDPRPALASRWIMCTVEGVDGLVPALLIPKAKPLLDELTERARGAVAAYLDEHADLLETDPGHPAIVTAREQKLRTSRGTWLTANARKLQFKPPSARFGKFAVAIDRMLGNGQGTTDITGSTVEHTLQMLSTVRTRLGHLRRLVARQQCEEEESKELTPLPPVIKSNHQLVTCDEVDFQRGTIELTADMTPSEILQRLHADKGFADKLEKAVRAGARPLNRTRTPAETCIYGNSRNLERALTKDIETIRALMRQLEQQILPSLFSTDVDVYELLLPWAKPGSEEESKKLLAPAADPSNELWDALVALDFQVAPRVALDTLNWTYQHVVLQRSDLPHLSSVLVNTLCARVPDGMRLDSAHLPVVSDLQRLLGGAGPVLAPEEFSSACVHLYQPGHLDALMKQVRTKPCGKLRLAFPAVSRLALSIAPRNKEGKQQTTTGIATLDLLLGEQYHLPLSMSQSHVKAIAKARIASLMKVKGFPALHEIDSDLGPSHFALHMIELTFPEITYLITKHFPDKEKPQHLLSIWRGRRGQVAMPENKALIKRIAKVGRISLLAYVAGVGALLP